MPERSNMIPAIIMDIDGTLANADHRLHLLTSNNGKPDWPSFLAAADLDTVNKEIRALNNAMYGAGYLIVICTGRDEGSRDMTGAWLEENGVLFDELLMRPAGDKREDTEIKAEHLAELTLRGIDPIFAVEDRARVTAMWRQQGIRCLQVCEGDY